MYHADVTSKHIEITIREDMVSDPRLMYPRRSVSPMERENRQKYKRDRVKETVLAGQQTQSNVCHELS